MIDPRLDLDRDLIALESVESYTRKKGLRPINTGYPIDAIIQENSVKSELYSRIAERMPTYAVYILSSDFENDDRAKGLFKALTNHSLQPEFIDILLQSLDQRRDPDTPKARAAVGALLIDIVVHYTAEKTAELMKAEAVSDDKKKKDKKEEKTIEKIDESVNAATEHIRRAAVILLEGVVDEIRSVCAGLKDHEALLIAGCVSIGGRSAIRKILKMDCPVTAEVFDIVKHDKQVFESILNEALHLEKADYTKRTTNQNTFLESLERYVYKTINSLENPQMIYQFLVYVYGSQKPENTQKYLIQLKDCGTTYSYLYSVAKQLFIKD